MAQQATPQSSPPVSALPATIFPLPQRLAHLPAWQARRFRPLRKVGYNYWSTTAAQSHMVDPEMIPTADQHLREYQALQPPKIVYGAGSYGLLATGTAKLTTGIESTAGKQREVNMSVILAPGLGRNLLSSSAALANGVETTVSAFPALKAKGENFPLRPGHSLYFSGCSPTETAEQIS